MNKTERRKEEHITIALEKNVAAHHNAWDAVFLPHNALPEVDQHDIDLSTRLFGKNLGAPLLISGMTGGFARGKDINDNLAATAEKFKIGLGVGSQRAALENPKLKATYDVITSYSLPLKIANIGASQIVLWDKKKVVEYAQQIIDMIDADVLAVCLNFLQEAVQPEGEAHAKGCLETITMLGNELSVPLIVKESGAGISMSTAQSLMTTPIAGIDIGGAGGTSFAAVEYYRADMKGDRHNMRMGKTFWDWGIPTPSSLMQVLRVTKATMPLIATGGIRNGLDAAKAIAMGADIAGIAHAMLAPATRSKEDAMFELEVILKELQTAMFLVGAGSVEELSCVDVYYDVEN